MKILHRNIFLYGVVLNLFAGIPLFAVDWLKYPVSGDLPRQPLFLFWIIFQGGIIAGVTGILFGLNQSIKFMEMQYLPDMLILVSLTGFLAFVFYLKASRKMYREDLLKSFTLDFFIIIPLLVFWVYFIILNFVRPAGFASSVYFLKAWHLNLLEAGFSQFVYDYFILIFISGLLYLVFLPVEFDGSLYRGIQFQWYLHTTLFLTGLYFHLEDLDARTQSFISKLFMPAVFIPCFIGALNLKYIKHKNALSKERILDYIIMFIYVYVFGKILYYADKLYNLLRFTDWVTGQNHVLAIGVVVPVLYILLSGFREKKADHAVYYSAWLTFVIILVGIDWLLGVLQSGMINKTGGTGFLEYPGWAAIVDNLRPWRMFRLGLELVFLFFLYLLYWRSLSKRRIHETYR